MLRRLRKLLGEERGATAVEYGLILSLVVLAVIGALSQTAAETLEMWTNVAAQVVGS